MRMLRRPSHASIVAYIALFVAATGTATAATGGSFLLGKTNTAGHTSVLKNNGPGAALQLKTKHATTPPLSVSGNTTKVPGLNADELDGLSAGQLQRKISNLDVCGPDGSINFVHANGTVRCGPRTFFAVVNHDGSLARGSVGVTSSKVASFTGAYVVGFGTDVSGCAFVSTVGNTGNGGTPPAGDANTAGRSADVKAVFVQTYNAAGTTTDDSFHLIVVCPPAASL
jgi:hypothetical protein